MTDIQARIARLQRRLVSRIEQTKDEKGFALLTALSFIVLMAGLTVVLLSVVLGQLTPTYLDQKTTKTVYSAQAGVQATLAVFRAIGTSPTYVYGDPSKLPCTITGNTTGSTTGGNTSCGDQLLAHSRADVLAQVRRHLLDGRRSGYSGREPAGTW
jgi:hypothetical protein